MASVTYLGWVVLALQVSVVTVGVAMVVTCVFYRDTVGAAVKKLLRRK